MIKVLDKSFAILEEIIAATPQPLGPLALAKKLGLNRTTCSRILGCFWTPDTLCRFRGRRAMPRGPGSSP